MYIEPNTNIRLLKNVPLNNKYDNTLFFESTGAQTSYFSSKTKHNLTKQTYQRVNRGVARIGISADKCYECNYMMFQNTSYGSKWFYAFITNVEYVNNEVCEVKFEIDELQSWFYSCELKECFIERNHSILDEINENTVPENVPLGEYVHSNVKNKFYTDLRVWVQYTKSNKETDKSVNGGIYGNIYSGLETIMIPNYDADSINNVLTNLLSEGNDIVNVYLAPESFRGVQGKAEVIDSEIKQGNVGSDVTLDGYTPKNNKMYTYPYNFCNVCSSSGDSTDYLFELSGKGTTFTIFNNSVGVANSILTKQGYKGLDINTQDIVTLNGFPLCSWSENGYLSYIATQAQADATKSLLGIVGVIGSFIGGLNPLVGVGGALTVGSKLTDIANIKRQPQKICGNTNSSYIWANNGFFGFTFSRVTVRREYAKLIDNYFSMYGYAIKQVGLPNINSRPHWNYIKTQGCNIVGEAPSSSISKICDIFDNGITFWKNGEEVGNYELDNSPV